MIIAVTIFLLFVMLGIVMGIRKHDMEEFEQALGLGLICFIFTMVILVGLVSQTNEEEFYKYEEKRMVLDTLKDGYLGVNRAKIIYCVDNKIYRYGAMYVDICLEDVDEPYVICRYYRGYNDDNKWRWLYTAPIGVDLYEFHVPQGSFSYNIDYNYR